MVPERHPCSDDLQKRQAKCREPKRDACWQSEQLQTADLIQQERYSSVQVWDSCSHTGWHTQDHAETASALCRCALST